MNGLLVTQMVSIAAALGGLTAGLFTIRREIRGWIKEAVTSNAEGQQGIKDSVNNLATEVRVQNATTDGHGQRIARLEAHDEDKERRIGNLESKK